MSILSLKIGGKDYAVACDDGEEEHLRTLGNEVDDRLRQLIFKAGGNPGEGLGLLLVGLMMADELSEMRRELDRYASEVHYLAALVQEGDATPDAERYKRQVAEMEEAFADKLEQVAERVERIAALAESAG